MRICMGADPAGFGLKEHLRQYLEEKGYEVLDLGTYNTESADYPVYGEKVARAVAAGEAPLGIICCGTGLGISMAAGKVAGIRAAVCTNEFMARMSRAHNDANILALGGRVVAPQMAEGIVDAFLETPFEGGRHARRVQMINDLDH